MLFDSITEYCTAKENKANKNATHVYHDHVESIVLQSSTHNHPRNNIIENVESRQMQAMLC